MMIDDLVFETLYGIYEDVSIGVSNSETDVESGIDFESSNSGSIPGAIKDYLVNSEAYIGITNLYNGVTKEYSNALTFGAVAGTNDAVAIVKEPSSKQYNATAFEADIMVDLNSEGYSYQIFFADKPKGECAYLLQIEYRNGKVKITDNSNSNNNAGINNTITSNLNGGEWFKLRVEYYESDTREDLRVKIYINNELLEVSGNFYGCQDDGKLPASVIDSVMLYSFSATQGSIYLDNLRFYGFSGTCNDEITDAVK
jgi:hypothetical protein